MHTYIETRNLRASARTCTPTWRSVGTDSGHGHGHGHGHGIFILATHPNEWESFPPVGRRTHWRPLGPWASALLWGPSEALRLRSRSRSRSRSRGVYFSKKVKPGMRPRKAMPSESHVYRPNSLGCIYSKGPQLRRISPGPQRKERTERIEPRRKCNQW